MKRKTIAPILMLVGGILLLWPSLSKFTPSPPSPARPVIPTPTAADQELVAPVTEALRGNSKDAADLARFYATLASAIERDSEVMTTTGQLRVLHARAGQMAFQETGLKERTPGLAKAAEAVVQEALGLENLPLQGLFAAKRKRAAEIFLALAWACAEAG